MEIKEKLVEAVGGEYFSDNPEILKNYSKDYSLVSPGMPNYVVEPKDTEELQKIMRLANEHRIPIVPCSSGVHFYGSTVPKQGGIMLNLNRMNRILEIDVLNRKAKIEPGVTWKQLQDELKKQDYMVMSPLLPHPKKSVLTSYLEREVLVNARYEHGDPLMAMEIVWPDGDTFRTGSASVPGYPDSFSEGSLAIGPGTLDFYRIIQGSQGTFGVVTWSNIKIEHLPRVNKTFFMPFNRVEDAIEPIYRILRRRIGYECFLMNRLDLAIILSETLHEDLEKLKEILPPWVMILILSGTIRRPEERIEFEEETLIEIKKAEFPDMEILSSLPGVPGLERMLPDMLRQPWKEETTYWKFCYKGASQDLFFITTLDKAAESVKAVEKVAGKYGYDINDFGKYLQPIEYGAGCFCEFEFYYDPKDSKEIRRIGELYEEAARELMNLEAFFTRPYGILADIVYEQAASYTMTLKRLKGVFDPNNIMSPGNLCF